MDCIHSIEGTCQYMCPFDEIKMREREGRIHQLESPQETIIDYRKNRKQQTANLSKMVKEYSRPAAGCRVPEPQSLRTAPTLIKTVEYIFNNIIPRTDYSWSTIYDFSFDRLRAVRQDMVIQRIAGLEAIRLLEQCVRFHVYAGYRLGTENIATFDPVINSQHAQECLKRLLVMYNEVEGADEFREQFESVYLLYNLGDVNAVRHCLSLNRQLRKSPLLRLAYAVSISHLTGNYVRTIRLARKLPCSICLCAFHRHLKHIQQSALRAMASGFSSKNSKFPCSKLQDLLAADCEREVEDMAESCGLNVSNRSICFLKTCFVGDKVLPTTWWAYLDEKLSEQNVSSLLLGETPTQTTCDVTQLERDMEELSVEWSSSETAVS